MGARTLPDPQLGFRPRECRRCGYALEGLAATTESVTCPECGETHHDRACLRCGYSLAGLPDAGSCPECSEPYAEQCLVLAGVPKSASVGPRRAAWIALMVGAFLLIQFWFVLPGWFTLILGMCVLLGVPMMLATSRRERSGVERFLLSPGGICRIPFAIPKQRKGAAPPPTGAVDTLFVAWGASDTVHIKRIGPHWKRLKVGRTSPQGILKDIVFDAGFRCPDGLMEQVRGDIQRLLDAHGSAPAQEEGPRVQGPSGSSLR